MRNLVRAAVLSMTLATVPVMAHHAAEGVVDEDVYAMIDSLVADTPHAEMTIDDLAYRMETTITVSDVRRMERMIDDGLLDYASMLDDEITVSIEFNPDGSTTMVITQDA
jgi:hypothetical protein